MTEQNKKGLLLLVIATGMWKLLRTVWKKICEPVNLSEDVKKMAEKKKDRPAKRQTGLDKITLNCKTVVFSGNSYIRRSKRST